MFSAPTRRAMLALAAGDRLGVTRQTVHALVKAGVLDGASGAGGRDLGVTLASVEAYEGGRRVRVAI